MCSHAIPAETARAYAIRYAVLRSAPIDAIRSGGVFAGQTPQNIVLNGDDLDAAIDATMMADARLIAAPTTPGPADDGERLTLGAINARLAPVSITVAGLTQLGFEPVAMDKAARLYRACDFPAICRAISEHALSAATKKATP